MAFGETLLHGFGSAAGPGQGCQFIQAGRRSRGRLRRIFVGRSGIGKTQIRVRCSAPAEGRGAGSSAGAMAIWNLLKEGLGTKVDKFEAYVWLLISFDAGFTRGAADLAALEAALGSTQLEQAKNRARDLERSVTRSVAAHGCTGWDGEFGTIPKPPPPEL